MTTRNELEDKFYALCLRRDELQAQAAKIQTKIERTMKRITDLDKKALKQLKRSNKKGRSKKP